MESKIKKILVVDDDVDFISQIRIQLENVGFEVITAEGVKEAENLLADKVKPDLAIIDLMMEHADSGFSLARDIKKYDASIPVIIITSVSSETGIVFDASTKEERSWIKADAVLNKPVRFEQLIREINKYLKG